MFNAQVRPARDLRNNYATIRELLKDHHQVIITNHGKGEAVLIGIDDYAEYEAFIHHRYGAEALKEAQVQAESPETKWLAADEVWDALAEKYGL